MMDRYKVEYNLVSGYWNEGCYDASGKHSTYKDSTGFWTERTYDASGNEITFKDSRGYWREGI